MPMRITRVNCDLVAVQFPEGHAMGVWMYHSVVADWLKAWAQEHVGRGCDWNYYAGTEHDRARRAALREDKGVRVHHVEVPEAVVMAAIIPMVIAPRATPEEARRCLQRLADSV
jgi:hypothetical protein